MPKKTQRINRNGRTSIERFFRRLKIYCKRLIRSELSSHEIALGVALGIFASILMPYLTHVIMALGLAYIFRVNKVGAILGTLFNNPLTAAPIYFFALQLGCFIWQVDPGLLATLRDTSGLRDFWQNVLEYGQSILVPMLTGLFLLGITCGFLGYVLTRLLVEWYRSRRGGRPTKLPYKRVNHA